MIESFHDWCTNPDKRTLVMGIVNVTPDSFSDGGKYYSSIAAIDFASKLIDEGADIIDIGGESTRPGADKVSNSDELRRVIPVIEGIRSNNNKILISIDTTKSLVAKKAVEVGANIINDVSGLSFDHQMPETIAQLKVPVIIMHMKGNPRNMQKSPKYENLIDEIITYFKEKIKIATNSGIDREMIILDPGIGFGKTIDHNFQILSELNKFNELKLPLLIGPSRKSFIGLTLDQSPEDTLDGTSATIAVGVNNGARIVRVHDVKNMKRVVIISDKIRNA